ncbi:paraquat-inducible membrane protein A [Sinirhodobacter populi]|uniref:Paraquat-inducible membrane protein A n=1 Tax=Paenirhodobacter populi TaxID=2306993 RepID=A0A443KHI2_9RHOB|nr:paraquat-inducible protein A [Sinirhodobacter populi]RWR32215.1 paraquat-inducible membrane protein A [Sinirhodobacter populi]
MSGPEIISATDAGLTGCTQCGKVWPAGTARCGRCGSHLHPVDTRSLQRVWAWWWAGLIFYIPANLFPMLRTSTMFGTQENTIAGGAVELAQHGDWAVALIILMASVLIPIAKFVAIAYLAFTVRMPGQRGGRHLMLYDVVEFIGRWSMIDVFVVAILSSLVQLGFVATIHPGPAAVAFALSVAFTMLSAQSFDPRLIWRVPPTPDPEQPAPQVTRET